MAAVKAASLAVKVSRVLKTEPRREVDEIE